MSNNYTQFAIALNVKNVEMVDAAIAFINNLDDYDYQTDDEDATVVERPDCFSEEDTAYMIQCVNDFGDGSSWRNEDNELWVYAEESANLELVAFVLQKLLIAEAIEGNYKSSGIVVTWANTCSKPRPDEFSGGACYVTKTAIHWQPDPISWIEDSKLTE